MASPNQDRVTNSMEKEIRRGFRELYDMSGNRKIIDFLLERKWPNMPTANKRWKRCQTELIDIEHNNRKRLGVWIENLTIPEIVAYGEEAKGRRMFQILGSEYESTFVPNNTLAIEILLNYIKAFTNTLVKVDGGWVLPP